MFIFVVFSSSLKVLINIARICTLVPFLIPKSSVADALYFDVDPDPPWHFDADPDPDPTCHFDADPDPDPDPSFQIKAPTKP